jgi:hypothetical protein
VAEFVLDWGREARTGVSEAVLCEGKTPAQIAAILAHAQEAGQRLLLTRLAPDALAALEEPLRARLDHHPRSRTAILGGLAPDPPRPGVGIVCAGTSDLAVGEEASRTLAFHGFAGPVIADVGVAGLWRLLDRLPELRAFRVVIARWPVSRERCSACWRVWLGAWSSPCRPRSVTAWRGVAAPLSPLPSLPARRGWSR